MRQPLSLKDSLPQKRVSQLPRRGIEGDRTVSAPGTSISPNIGLLWERRMRCTYHESLGFCLFSS